MWKRKLKCFLPLLLTAAFFLQAACSPAQAIEWPEARTGAQEQLQTYVGRVNENLRRLNAQEINSIFEYYTYLATLGVTTFDDSSMPEGVELTFSLYNDTLNSLVLRVSDPDSFAPLAASCIQAAAPSGYSLEELLEKEKAFARQVKEKPLNSVREPVISQNGTEVRVYHAYYPDKHLDNWMEITLIFSLTGFSDHVLTTAAPQQGEADIEYEGYYAQDDGDHLELFTTPTPEPDSPAGGYWE